MPPVTADQLRRAETAFKKSYKAMEGDREKRNEMVRGALAQGWTHQRISDITGLSRGRISQIAASKVTEEG